MAKGPLAARLSDGVLEHIQAGTVAETNVVIENTGTSPWGIGVVLSYHWLDDLDNMLIWDGERTPLPPVVVPGEQISVGARVRAPVPPGRYKLAFDLVAEGVVWFSALGAPLQPAPVEVVPRRGTAQLDLPPFVEPAGDFLERAGALHAEGYAVVGGSIAWDSQLGRRAPHELAPYAVGSGRNPNFAHPLICPSVLEGVTLQRLPDIAGLPAFAAPTSDTWMYDGRLVLHIRPHSATGE
jgi:hypothetical protein